MSNVLKPGVVEGPPASQLVDPDEEYVRSQGESVGSGLLGGWSQANLGGYFEERPSREIRDEIRRLVRAARAAAGSP